MRNNTLISVIKFWVLSCRQMRYKVIWYLGNIFYIFLMCLFVGLSPNSCNSENQIKPMLIFLPSLILVWLYYIQCNCKIAINKKLEFLQHLRRLCQCSGAYPMFHNIFMDLLCANFFSCIIYPKTFTFCIKWFPPLKAVVKDSQSQAISPMIP